MRQIKSFFILIFLLFSVFNVANAQIKPVSELSPYELNDLKTLCGQDSSFDSRCNDLTTFIDVDASGKLPEASAKNIEHLKDIGQIKVTQAQIRKISNPIEVLRQGAEKYTSKLRGYAEKLFFWLALLSFAWHFGFLALKRADMGEFFAEFTKFWATTAVFYWLLMNGSAIGIAIFDSFSTDMATKTSGFSGKGYDIIEGGFLILSAVSDGTGVSLGTPMTIVIYFFKLLAGVVCLILLGILAINYWILQATGYLVLCLGVIVLGFGGSWYTREWAITYFRNAIAIGIKLLVMTLIIAVGIEIIKGMTGLQQQETMRIIQGTNLNATFTEAIILLATTILLFKVADSVPNIVSSFIGNAGGTGNGVSASGMSMVAMAAAPFAAAATGAKVLGAMKSGNLSAKEMGTSLMQAMQSGNIASFGKIALGKAQANISSAESKAAAEAEASFRSSVLNALGGGKNGQ